MSEEKEKSRTGQLPKDELIGQTLGQFEILEEVGRGGMATVYRARQLSINRIVAIKVLPRNLLHDPTFYDRFEREVDVVARLEHPHILPIYDYGHAEGLPYIVMRYLGGGSLAQTIRLGPPPLEKIERPLTQIAQALDHAHKEGIIHRDLKPGNIMLDENGNAYLTDFGIARVLDSNLTGSAIIGTPAYMSPEQANGMPLDARSDIYALGVVLFELITGREPYQAETPMALLLKHINEPMPPLRNFRADVPPPVEGVIAKATAKDPDHRFASAGEMALAFREALQGRPMTAAAALSQPLQEDMPTMMPTTPPTGGVARAATSPVVAASTGQAAVPSTGQMGGSVVEDIKPSRSPIALIATLLVVLVIVGAIVALVVLPNLPGRNVTPTPGPAVWVQPTPFAGADVAAGDEYTVSVPGDWAFVDRSDEDRQVYLWQSGEDAFVSLVLLPDRHDPDDFEDAIEEYQEDYYEPVEDTLTLIDEGTAPDGSVRRSYRLVGATDPAFPPGQMDVFYMLRGETLVVVETYTADSTGNDLVETMQAILDSLRIGEQVATG